MEKRWIVREVDERIVSNLADQLTIPPLIARILALRGLTEPDSARRFLSSSLRSDLPSPFLMAGMEKAAARLVRALQLNELICVWGDYDVDGTTGASALVSFLREVGAQAIYHVPHRISEGYGLNSSGIRQLKSQGVGLVVSVDCGISNYREIELAQGLGVDVVVVDHHEPPPQLPPALAIINPHRSDCPFPDKGLSGAGLAFYLIIGLRARLREADWFEGREAPDIRRYLDIVTLGTIADMVPLTGVNRVLARRGLTELSDSARPGIVALKEVARLARPQVGVGQVAFQLGPRINAAGRMDAGLKVVEMLTTESAEVALRIARELDEHNRERQAMEARVLEEALTQAGAGPRERYSVVLGQEGWHPGVLGIVASRIVERFHRPTVVIGFSAGEGKGSARAIRGFHMVEGLRRCADLLEKFGGHEYAGGLTIRQERFPLFADRFEEVARESLAQDDLVPTLEVDAALDFSDLGLALVRQLEALKPFGVGNPEPLFMSSGIEVSERREFNGGSRLRLRQGNRYVGAVYFDSRSRASVSESRGDSLSRRETPDSRLHPGATIDVLYRLTENQWNGLSSAELRIVDCRPCAGK